MRNKLFLLMAVVLLFGGVMFLSATGANEGPGGPLTLQVWDQFSGGADRQTIEQIGMMFAKKYPNITIERSAKTTEDILNVLRPAFMAGNAPDVIYGEMGLGWAGPFFKSGFLMDLTDVWKDKGWNDKLSPASKLIPTINGRTYGVGHELEATALYYNKTKFQELGLSIPRTIDEMEGVLQKIKDAGFVPLAYTLDDQWYRNMNYIGAALYAFMSKEEIRAVADKDGPWDIPAVRNTVERCVIQWAQKGYLMPHPETNQDILAAFANQTGMIFPTGNWDIARLREVIGSTFEIGIFDWPSGTKGVKPSAVNFVGSGYLINAKTKYRQAAIDYVDFVLATPESAKVWFEVAKKIPPYVKEIPGLQVDPLIAAVRAALANPQVQNYPGINMWLPPNAFDFFSTAGQKMVLGSMTSQGFVDGVIKAYDIDRSNKTTRATFQMSQ